MFLRLTTLDDICLERSVECCKKNATAQKRKNANANTCVNYSFLTGSCYNVLPPFKLFSQIQTPIKCFRRTPNDHCTRVIIFYNLKASLKGPIHTKAFLKTRYLEIF